MTPTINMWTRSTDVRDLLECQIKWLLKRLYPPDFLPTWNPLGTVIHAGIYDVLIGNADLEDAINGAKAVAAKMLTENPNLPVRGTKKRTPQTIDKDIDRMLRKWWQAVIVGEVEEYQSLDLDSAEGEVVVNVPAETMGTMAPMRTTIDAIIPLSDASEVFYAIVDWKSGATAHADPLQLYTYLYAARHDPNSPLYQVNPSAVELWFHHLDFGKIQRAEDYPGDDYIREMLRWTEATKRSMRETGFAPPHPDWYCDYCTVKSHCPAFGGDLRSVARDARLLTLDYIPEPEESNGREE